MADGARGGWLAPHFDDTDHPLVRMTFTGSAGPRDHIAFMARVEALVATGERFVLVLDEGMAHALSTAGSWHLLPWALRWRRHLRRTCAAVAVTMTQATLPRAGRATRAIACLIPAPLAIFMETAMAEQWVHSRLVPAPVIVRPALVPSRGIDRQRES